MAKGEALNERQRQFVNEYLVDLNATQAALRAGYAERSAAVTASRMLKNPKIQELIQERRDALAEALDVDQTRVLRELAIISFSDIRRYFRMAADGYLEVCDLTELPRELSAAIESFQMIRTPQPDGLPDKVTMRLKLHSKTRGIEMLGRHLGLFEADEAQRRKKDVESLAALIAEAEAAGMPAEVLYGGGKLN